MTWDGLARTEAQLSEQLGSYDWPAVARTCEALITRMYTEPDPMPEATARRLLAKLRRKRRFGLMRQLAEALMHSGQDSANVRRQYAQALIDLGLTSAPEFVLNSLLTTDESVEASGLTGRIYKQLYVNVGSARHRPNVGLLERAYQHYLGAYDADPTENLWHGINAVALLERGNRDGATIASRRTASDLAKAILATVDERARSNQGSLEAWDLAVRLEALVALSRHEEAETAAFEYVASDDADAFELASTLRQLTEVWQLSDDQEPGSHVLPVLRAALLRREGGGLQRTPSQVRDEIEHLERVFGPDKTQTLTWYLTGLNRCASIARIERIDGKPHGTGWIVNAGKFFPEQANRRLVLTNTHVVSSGGFPTALGPSEARVHFQVREQMYEIDEIIWSSPVEELDATFLSVSDGPPLHEPLPLHEEPVVMAEPAPRMYVIGHPGGRDVELSLQDNRLLACDERVLHYRSPTEPGSSGSPVFEQHGWRVAALHHMGDYDMPRLGGLPGTYEANVGVAIRAIQKATRGQ